MCRCTVRSPVLPIDIEKLAGTAMTECIQRFLYVAGEILVADVTKIER